MIPTSWIHSDIYVIPLDSITCKEAPCAQEELDAVDSWSCKLILKQLLTLNQEYCTYVCQLLYLVTGAVIIERRRMP
jgi:hypothetical protein